MGQFSLKCKFHSDYDPISNYFPLLVSTLLESSFKYGPHTSKFVRLKVHLIKIVMVRESVVYNLGCEEDMPVLASSYIYIDSILKSLST